MGCGLRNPWTFRGDGMDAVSLDAVSKSYGSYLAVDELSLRVERGAIFGFIGPNGSGKTTTLRMILHILHPDGGRIEVLEQDGRRAANDRIGYLPEERGLYRKMTVRRVLSYYAGLKGMGAKEALDASNRWLERLGLSEWATKKVETLSKGMQQKVQFIATVVSSPELVILDEPFSGLDPVNLDVLREAILELRSAGTTVIFSTHDMGKAEEMCDSLCMIFKGKKVLDGTLDEIKERYGADTIRVRGPGAKERLASFAGIEKIIDRGHTQEIRLREDVGPPQLLHHLSEGVELKLSEVAQPSLHDIFVRIAGPEATAANGVAQ